MVPLLVAVVVIVAVIVLISRHATTEATPGVVSALSGKVETAGTDSAWEPATITQELAAGYKLHTGPESTALVQWPGATLLVLAESTVAIASSAKTGGDATLHIDLQLNSGRIRFRAAPTEEHGVQVVATTGTIALPVSEGTCSLSADASGRGTATVLRGKALAGAAGGAMVPVTERQALDLTSLDDPIRIRPISATEAAEWEKDAPLLNGSAAGGKS